MDQLDDSSDLDWQENKTQVDSRPNEILADNIVYEKLSLVDESYLLEQTRKTLQQKLVILSSLLSICFFFFFFVIHCQSKDINQLQKKYLIMENIVEKLANTISESALNDLFIRVYNSTVVDAKHRMDSIYRQIASDQASLLADYEVVKMNYNRMESRFSDHVELIDSLKRTVDDLQSAIADQQQELSLVHRRVLVDGTDRIDYAYEKNGGQVMTGLKWTTNPPISLFSSHSQKSIDPKLAINPPSEKGFCYPMDSIEPIFSVRIAQPRNPFLFSVDHVSRFVADDRRSALKRYEVWGYESERAGPVLLAKQCYYDINGDQTQLCYSDYDGNKRFLIFKLHILENWGADFTCLYRFRVHCYVCCRTHTLSCGIPRSLRIHFHLGNHFPKCRIQMIFRMM